MKKPGSRRSKADQRAVENLVASAIADIMCAGTGLPGFGSVERAESALREALGIDPSNLEALNILAQCCAQTGRHDEAWSLFVDGLDAAPEGDDLVRLTCALAETYEDREAYPRAIRLYREALTRHEDPALHVGLGYCLGKISRLEDSVRQHRRAAEMAPEDPKVLNDLGHSLVMAGRLQEAERALLRALELDPHYTLANGNLEHCRSLMREVEER